MISGSRTDLHNRLVVVASNVDGSRALDSEVSAPIKEDVEVHALQQAVPQGADHDGFALANFAEQNAPSFGFSRSQGSLIPTHATAQSKEKGGLVP
jgi:hypothetical protein